MDLYTLLLELWQKSGWWFSKACIRSTNVISNSEWHLANSIWTSVFGNNIFLLEDCNTSKHCCVHCRCLQHHKLWHVYYKQFLMNNFQFLWLISLWMLFTWLVFSTWVTLSLRDGDAAVCILLNIDAIILSSGASSSWTKTNNCK